MRWRQGARKKGVWSRGGERGGGDERKQKGRRRRSWTSRRRRKRRRRKWGRRRGYWVAHSSRWTAALFTNKTHSSLGYSKHPQCSKCHMQRAARRGRTNQYSSIKQRTFQKNKHSDTLFTISPLRQLNQRSFCDDAMLDQNTDRPNVWEWVTSSSAQWWCFSWCLTPSHILAEHRGQTSSSDDSVSGRNVDLNDHWKDRSSTASDQAESVGAENSNCAKSLICQHQITLSHSCSRPPPSRSPSNLKQFHVRVQPSWRVLHPNYTYIVNHADRAGPVPRLLLEGFSCTCSVIYPNYRSTVWNPCVFCDLPPLYI